MRHVHGICMCCHLGYKKCEIFLSCNWLINIVFVGIYLDFSYKCRYNAYWQSSPSVYLSVNHDGTFCSHFWLHNLIMQQLDTLAQQLSACSQNLFPRIYFFSGDMVKVHFNSIINIICKMDAGKCPLGFSKTWFNVNLTPYLNESNITNVGAFSRNIKWNINLIIYNYCNTGAVCRIWGRPHP